VTLALNKTKKCEVVKQSDIEGHLVKQDYLTSPIMYDLINFTVHVCRIMFSSIMSLQNIFIFTEFAFKLRHSSEDIYTYTFMFLCDILGFYVRVCLSLYSQCFIVLYEVIIALCPSAIVYVL
jgi:hypothetical protein